MREVKPNEVMLGNFISCFGKTEMITAIPMISEGQWHLDHRAWHQKDNPVPEGILLSPMAIPLDEAWKKCLHVDQYKFPPFIEYVHQAQNYMMWYAGVNLLDTLDWNLLPKSQE